MEGKAPGPAGESIWVGVRIRPPSHAEIKSGEPVAWTAQSGTVLRYHECEPRQDGLQTPHRGGTPGGKSRKQQTTWVLDRVLGPEAGAAEVYSATASGIVASSMDGLNGTVFAYGQTGSGKTYTMRSIMAMAAKDIFAFIAANPEREFLLHVSAMEIYNEVVWDLLSDRPEPLRLLDDPDRGTVVESLTEEGVSSLGHLTAVLMTVERRRHVRDTRVNANSSRSHQIVQLRIESRPTGGAATAAEEAHDPELASAAPGTELTTSSVTLGDGGDEGSPPAEGAVTVATLTFVDLAGSERADRSLVGDKHDNLRLKEGIHINRSLLTLGTVMRELSSGKRGGHVPYRNSKLTRILQPALGGNARTAVVCTVAPTASHIDNTRSTLHFAAAAKRVTNTPRVNRVMDSKALIRGLHVEIAHLRAKLDTAAVDAAHELLQETLRKKEAQFAGVLAERDQVLRRLRNLERLILRGAPGSARRRPRDARLSPLALGSAPASPVRSGASGAAGDLRDACAHSTLSGGGHGHPLELASGRRRGSATRARRTPRDLGASWGGGALGLTGPGEDGSAEAGEGGVRARPAPGGGSGRKTRRRLFHNEPWFLDLFLTPRVRRQIRRLQASDESEVNNYTRLRRGRGERRALGATPERALLAADREPHLHGAAERAPSETSGVAGRGADISVALEAKSSSSSLSSTPAPHSPTAPHFPASLSLDAQEAEAFETLQAEVRCLRHSAMHGTPGGTPGAEVHVTVEDPASPEDANGDAPGSGGRGRLGQELDLKVQRLEEELRRMEAEAAGAASRRGGGGEEAMRAMRNVLARAKEEASAERSALAALASLSAKLSNLSLPPAIHASPAPSALTSSVLAASLPRPSLGGHPTPPSGSRAEGSLGGARALAFGDAELVDTAGSYELGRGARGDGQSAGPGGNEARSAGSHPGPSAHSQGSGRSASKGSSTGTNGESALRRAASAASAAVGSVAGMTPGGAGGAVEATPGSEVAESGVGASPDIAGIFSPLPKPSRALKTPAPMLSPTPSPAVGTSVFPPLDSDRAAARTAAGASPLTPPAPAGALGIFRCANTPVAGKVVGVPALAPAGAQKREPPCATNGVATQRTARVSFAADTGSWASPRGRPAGQAPVGHGDPNARSERGAEGPREAPVRGCVRDGRDMSASDRDRACAGSELADREAEAGGTAMDGGAGAAGRQERRNAGRKGAGSNSGHLASTAARPGTGSEVAAAAGRGAGGAAMPSRAVPPAGRGPRRSLSMDMRTSGADLTPDDQDKENMVPDGRTPSPHRASPGPAPRPAPLHVPADPSRGPPFDVGTSVVLGSPVASRPTSRLGGVAADAPLRSPGRGPAEGSPGNVLRSIQNVPGMRRSSRRFDVLSQSTPNGLPTAFSPSALAKAQGFLENKPGLSPWSPLPATKAADARPAAPAAPANMPVTTSAPELTLAEQEAVVQQVWAYAQDWYTQQLATVQHDLRTSIERDVESIKGCIESYREQIARLTCQKRMLLQQVLKMEMKAEEERAENKSLQRQLRKARTQLEAAQQQVAEARAAVAHANVAASEAVARAREAEEAKAKAQQPPMEIGAVPRGNPWGDDPADADGSASEALWEDDAWAAAPHERSLMPRIMRLWEALGVPLIHRSRFVLSFRGKETFYFEGEHRRLEWMRGRLDRGGAEGGAGAREAKAAERDLLRARKELEEERNFLAAQLARKVPRGPGRDQVYEEFGMDVMAKRRKFLFAANLWTRAGITDYPSLWRHSEVVLELYGERPGDRMQETAFEAARVRPGRRGLLSRAVGGRVEVRAAARHGERRAGSVAA